MQTQRSWDLHAIPSDTYMPLASLMPTAPADRRQLSSTAGPQHSHQIFFFKERILKWVPSSSSTSLSLLKVNTTHLLDLFVSWVYHEVDTALCLARFVQHYLHETHLHVWHIARTYSLSSLSGIPVYNSITMYPSAIDGLWAVSNLRYPLNCLIGEEY